MITAKPTLRLKIYRTFVRSMMNRWVLSRLVSSTRQEKTLNHEQLSFSKKSVPRYWFHASSVGELESLWSVIAACSEHSCQVVVTIFSESADGAIRRLASELAGKKAEVIFTGYSPWEGHWQSCLNCIKPDFFVTAKYEAWPELWAGLALQEIPLIIVGAKARRSLQTAKRICRAVGVALPEMVLLPVEDEEKRELSALFPCARVEAIGDPRWDRVAERASKGNARARDLVDLYKNSPRPWGVLGSAWPEDLQHWQGVMRKAGGTVWVVPHRIDPTSLAKIEGLLVAEGFNPVRTSSQRVMTEVKGECLLVDEMGFLSELYGVADWAYVGGGFTMGVHSTIEPAIHGIPIAIGPKNAPLFSEIGQLQRTEQLQIVLSSEDLGVWLENTKAKIPGHRDVWKEQAIRRLGATKRVLEMLSP